MVWFYYREKLTNILISHSISDLKNILIFFFFYYGHRSILSFLLLSELVKKAGEKIKTASIAFSVLDLCFSFGYLKSS